MKNRHPDFGLIVVAGQSLSVTMYNQAALRVESVDEGLNTRKPLMKGELVPRAGLEPARPYLTNPRILSPIPFKPIYLNYLHNGPRETESGPHSGLTELSINDHLYPNVRILHSTKSSRNSPGGDMKKPWLTEREIGDLLWKDPFGNFGTGPWHTNHQYFREPQLGTIRPDFMGISACDGGLHIQLIELKITADANSVAQLVKYQNFWLDQFDHYRNFKMPKAVQGKGFEIEMQLFARFFEASVYPLAKALNICLQRVSIISSSEVSVDWERDADKYQYDPTLNGLLLNHFKDDQHGEAIH